MDRNVKQHSCFVNKTYSVLICLLKFPSFVYILFTGKLELYFVHWSLLLSEQGWNFRRAFLYWRMSTIFPISVYITENTVHVYTSGHGECVKFSKNFQTLLRCLVTSEMKHLLNSLHCVCYCFTPGPFILLGSKVKNVIAKQRCTGTVAQW